MITTRPFPRTVSRRTYIRVERSETRSLTPVVLMTFACCMALIVVLSLMTTVHEDARQQYMERLEKENAVMVENRALKTELVAITQRGYVEFVAEDRLGLKKPKDSEVMVLR
jgi:hypothetical protein